MGELQGYTCNNCQYTAEASTKKEMTMTYVLSPFICKNCTELVMVPTGEFGLNERLDDEAYMRCPNCHSRHHLTNWKPKKRPCPKCDKGQMQPNGIVIMVD
jgi:DNA-directed RNA polymerase subunit RPC12/RpoP